MSSSKHPNSLWEMGAHDIYILDYLFDGYGQTIKNIMGNISHCMFDLEYSNRENVKSPYAYSDKPIHTINAYVEVCNDWNKTRIICINGSKKQAVFDDEANEDVKIVVRNNETREVQFIRIESQPSPLETQCKHFFDCITNRINPIANAFDGYKNISILQSVSNLLNTKL
jgi:predicted dehydrogenase